MWNTNYLIRNATIICLAMIISMTVIRVADLVIYAMQS